MSEQSPAEEKAPASEEIPEIEKPPAAELPEPERPPAGPPPVTARRERRRGYRSLFWPMVLIGAGVLWLLSNLGVIGADNWSVLVRLWPILLIAVGLDVLFGRLYPALGALIGLVAVGATVALVLIGPSMGWAGSTSFFGLPFAVGDVEVKHEQIVAPLDGAEAADVTLALSFETATVGALPGGSSNLIEGELDYVGDLHFDVSGGRTRQVRLREENAQVFSLSLLPLNQEPRWDIRLNPDVPLSVSVDVGSGSAELDLSALQLSDLDVEGGSGSTALSLPAMPDTYAANVSARSGSFRMTVPDGAQVELLTESGSGSFRLETGSGSAVSMRGSSGSGSVNIQIGADADFDLALESGSGSVSIQTPAGAAVRVEVRESGSGSVSMQGGLYLIDDGGDDDPKTGIWESPGFEGARHQIRITLSNQGSGSFSVR